MAGIETGDLRNIIVIALLLLFLYSSEAILINHTVDPQKILDDSNPLERDEVGISKPNLGIFNIVFDPLWNFIISPMLGIIGFITFTTPQIPLFMTVILAPISISLVIAFLYYLIKGVVTPIVEVVATAI